MEAIKRLEELEREVKNLRGLVLFERDAVLEKKIVSLRGMGKLKVSVEELEEAMEEAMESLFAGNDICD
jgi:hypothetical protein